MNADNHAQPGTWGLRPDARLMGSDFLLAGSFAGLGAAYGVARLGGTLVAPGWADAVVAFFAALGFVNVLASLQRLFSTRLSIDDRFLTVVDVWGRLIRCSLDELAQIVRCSYSFGGGTQPVRSLFILDKRGVAAARIVTRWYRPADLDSFVQRLGIITVGSFNDVMSANQLQERYPRLPTGSLSPHFVRLTLVMGLLAGIVLAIVAIAMRQPTLLLGLGIGVGILVQIRRL